jgi:hypothetical protein
MSSLFPYSVVQQDLCLNTSFSCWIRELQKTPLHFDSSVSLDFSVSLHHQVHLLTKDSILKMASKFQLPLRFAQLASSLVVLGLSIYGRLAPP